MTDIVERLHEKGLGFGIGPAGLCQEAAEEIQRLREALEEVRPLVVGANHSKERYPKANAALAKGDE